MLAEVHVNDIGTVFRIAIVDNTNTVIDISTATKLDFIFKKPDGTIMTKAGALFTNGADGIIEYVTLSGDINQTSKWKIQAHVILPTGEWFSTIGEFYVHGNLI